MLKLRTLLKRHTRLAASIILLTSFLTACSGNASKKTAANTEKFEGGFLGKHYSLLQKATSPSGQPTMRWVSPKLKPANYDRILIEKPLLANPDNFSDQQLLSDIKATLQKDMGIKLQGIFGITTKAKPRTLRLRTAITSVSAKEVVSPASIPVELLSDDNHPALTFDQSFVLFIEFEVTDAMTGELLGVGIRRNDGSKLPAGEKIALAQIAPVINSWAHDARLFFKKR